MPWVVGAESVAIVLDVLEVLDADLSRFVSCGWKWGWGKLRDRSEYPLCKFEVDGLCATPFTRFWRWGFDLTVFTSATFHFRGRLCRFRRVLGYIYDYAHAI